MNEDKQKVHDFWDNAACGEKPYLKDHEKESYLKQSNIRYQLEPYIIDFADFNSFHGKTVLEIGVGLGADHQRWAEAGCDLYGVDFTSNALTHTQRRLQVFGLNSQLSRTDAEDLPFKDDMFDLVFSWGCLHHTPDTPKAIGEVFRVLKKDGIAKVMIYNKKSFVGYMLWIRYGLLAFKPFTSLDTIYSKYLESPGTKAYMFKDAYKLFGKFSKIQIETILSHGDLLESQAGQRHKGPLLVFARLIWPRWLIKTFFKNHGLFMMIQAKK